MKRSLALLWALFSLIACDSKAPPAPSALSPDTAIFPLPGPKTQDDPADNPWLSGFGGAPDRGQQATGTQSHAGPSDAKDQPASGAGDDVPSSDVTPTDQPLPDDPHEHRDALPDLSPRLELIEYLEGQGTDKVLSLANNGTGTEGSCNVEVYVNGGTTPWRTMPLSPLPAPGETASYCSAAVSGRACLAEISGSTFNGNDALLVRCNGELTDSFGQVGYDPGAGWGSEAIAKLTTKDSHWLRCIGPDREATDPFFIDEQWILYPEAENLSAALETCKNSAPLNLGGAASQ